MFHLYRANFRRSCWENWTNRIVAVRLGITGKGIQPNYQLIHTDHSVTTINGANHEKYDGADEFKGTNITEPLTRSDITRMILTGK